MIRSATVGGLTMALSGLAIAPAFAQRANLLIVPGRSVGGVRIGGREGTLNKLGTPSTGDGAMQKQWLTWYSKPNPDQPNAVPAELDIYLRPNSDGAYKYIDRVRVTSSAFRTADGLGAGSSFERIKRACAHLTLIKTYSTKKSNGPIRIYDAINQGIAFEIYRGRDGKAAVGQCSAVVVHRPGANAEDGYLRMSDYLQTIADTPAVPNKPQN